MNSLHTYTKSNGFTIVELLIVVVVIAILAAITIVSYTGITNRANASSSKGTATNLQKKIETYVADSTVGNYPTTLSALSATGNSWTTPAAVWTDGSTVNPTITATTASDVAQYQVCGRASSGTGTVAAPTNLAGVTSGVVTGSRVVYWNYTASPAQQAFLDMGISQGGTVVIGAVTYNVACYPPTS